jgi:hypothetical protein
MSIDSTDADAAHAKGAAGGSANTGEGGQQGEGRAKDEAPGLDETNVRRLVKIDKEPDAVYDLVPAFAPTRARRGLAYFVTAVGAGLAVGYLFGSGASLKKGAQDEHAALTQALPANPNSPASEALRSETARLSDDIGAIRAQVEQLRRGADILRAGERLHTLETAREENRESAKAFATRIEKLEARLAQLERVTADRTTTGSLPKDRIAKPNNEPRADAKATAQGQPTPSAPKSITNYSLRDVYHGVALVERRDGLLEEVSRGDELQGAGRVTAIERRADGWVVVTTKGVIDQHQ